MYFDVHTAKVSNINVNDWNKIVGLLATRKRNTRATFLQVRTFNERAIHFEEISVDFASVVACYWLNDDLHRSR